VSHRAALTTVLFALALSPASAFADGVLPSAATPVQREQAQAKFLRGRDLFSQKKFDEALAEYKASIEIVASPNTRLQISRTLRAMGKFVAAYAELGRTLVEAKELTAQDNRYQRAYDAAIQERTELQPLLGFVSLTVQNPTEGTRILVGTEEIRPAAWTEPVPIYGGKADIEVDTPGHAPVKVPVNVAPGAKADLTIDAQSGALEATAEAPPPPPPPAAPPPPPPPPQRSMTPLRLGAYVAGGVGVIGLATFAIFGAMAGSTYSDLQSACGGGPCPPSKADEISSGKTQQVVANVGLGVGIVGLAAGGTLFVLSLKKSAPEQPAASGLLPALAARASLVVSPFGAMVRGSF
jgi:hypothetical protein